jgi:hypothetical protein
MRDGVGSVNIPSRLRQRVARPGEIAHPSGRSSFTPTRRSTGTVSKISILSASLGSSLCMIALFVGVALASGPVTTAVPPGGQPGAAASKAALCFLHRL